jgi:hypothetical protein
MAIGNGALYHNTSGSNSIAIGAKALYFSNANTNVGIGYYAGYSSYLGGNNTFIGGQAGNTDGTFASAFNMSGSSAFGYNAQVARDSSIVIGASNDTTLKVGLGDTVPTNFFSAGAYTGTSGTASVTLGSASVTRNGGTAWVASALVGQQFNFTDGTSYTVTANTTTTVTLNVIATATEASANYRTYYQGLQVINDGTVFTQGNSTTQFTVKSPAGSNVLAVDTTNTTVALTSSSNASSLLTLTNNTVTSNTVASISSSSLTTGSALSITSAALTSGTAIKINAGTGIALQVASSGATIDLNSGTTGSTTILKLPTRTSGTCSNGVAEGLIFKDNGGTQRGHACIDSGTPVLKFYANAFNAANTDVAENYSDTSNTLAAGDLVALDTTGTSVKAITKATSNNKDQLFGVISTNPGFVLSGIDDSNGATDLVHPKPVALSGRIPTHVNTENGVITIGDYLTISSTPGVAAKATGSGLVIGRALENYNGSTTGTIEVLAQNFYYAPTAQDLLQNGSVGSLTANGLLTTTDLKVTATATIAALHVTGNAILDHDLVVSGDTIVHKLTVNGKIITAGTTPTAVLGDTTITGQNASYSIEGNDTAGSVSFKAGTVNSPAYSLGAGAEVNFSFTSPYTTAPRISFTPKNDKSAVVKYYVETSATGFTLKFVDTPVAGSTYLFDYIVIQ